MKCKGFNNTTYYLFLLFGENPQSVAYLAQPLCWSGGELLPHHSQGSSTERWSRDTPEGGHCQSVLRPQGVFNVRLYF